MASRSTTPSSEAGAPAPAISRAAARHWLTRLALHGTAPDRAGVLSLAALLDRPRHGYGILGEVEVLSEGRVRLRVGTLYGVLDRLVTEGLVARDREELHQGRLRRYYRLTPDGRGILEAEVERQASNARAATRRLRATRPLGGTA